MQQAEGKRKRKRKGKKGSSRSSSRSVSPRAAAGSSAPFGLPPSTPIHTDRPEPAAASTGLKWTVPPSAQMAFIAKPDQGAQGRGIELFLDPRPLLETAMGSEPVGNAIARCVARSVKGNGGGSEDEDGSNGEDEDEDGSGTDEDTGDAGWKSRADRASKQFLATSAAATAAAAARRQGVGVSSWANSGITRALVQSYIPKPLLLDGHKFDLRIYLLVSSVFPTLRAFLYADGLVRFATQPYANPTRSNLRKKTGHLTNYSINKGKAMATEVKGAGEETPAAGDEEEEE